MWLLHHSKNSVGKFSLGTIKKFNSDLHRPDIYAIDWNAVTGQCKDLHKVTACTIHALKSMFKYQFGFRTGYSTEQAILELTDRLKQAMAKKKEFYLWSFS